MEIKGRIVRNANDEVLVKERIYWNIEVMDRWYKNDKPTKGIRLNIEEAKTLLNILKRELE